MLCAFLFFRAGELPEQKETLLPGQKFRLLDGYSMMNLKRLFAHETVSLVVLLGVAQLPAAETQTKGKATTADAPASKQAKAADEETKTAVRIVVLKGAYEDHPASMGLDRFTILSGDTEKPGSFFALCEKLDEMAENDEIQHVVFDLSAPGFRMNLAQLLGLNR